MKLHHTGFVVKDIDKYAKNHPLGECVAQIIDPVQHAKLALYSNHSEVLVELIQPFNELSFTWNALNKNGNHFHHFCYTVKTFSAAEKYASDFKMIKVLGPLPAVLFGGLEVVFYYSRNQQVVEFLIDPNYEL
jgi:hypothetical protein